jgi:hypothetical protein
MTSVFDGMNPELLRANQNERLRELRTEQERNAQLAEAGYAPPSPRARIAGILLRLALLLDARIAARSADIHQPAIMRHA